VIDDASLHARTLASMEAFYAFLGDTGADAGGRTLRRDGVVASVCPAMARRSVFNSVVYHDAVALEAALDDVAAAYAAAGVEAWTVWTPERDAAARALLEAAGHVLDATPQAMAAPLEEIDLGAGAEGLDWERAPGTEDMCAILEVAFHWEAAGARAVFAALPEAGHVYVARADGRPVACVAGFDVEGDCAIWNVGTLPEARGRGLATALMRQALLDARDRGCATTSLQATAMGRPVYRRLGYRDLGVLEMWERRRPAT
jgi:ribosomal protein S18 acetylase RimI-like enzyme